MADTTERDRVLALVSAERDKQDAKWGEQNHEPLTWAAILGEEFGEVSKAVLEKDMPGYVMELIQVAAVAVSALECAARGKVVSVEQRVAEGRKQGLEEAAIGLIESRTCKAVHSFQPSQCENCYWFDCAAAAIRALKEKA